MDTLGGIVDIYHVVNSLDINSITKSIPDFDLDINRTFPDKRD